MSLPSSDTRARRFRIPSNSAPMPSDSQPPRSWVPDSFPVPESERESQATFPGRAFPRAHSHVPSAIAEAIEDETIEDETIEEETVADDEALVTAAESSGRPHDPLDPLGGHHDEHEEANEHDLLPEDALDQDLGPAPSALGVVIIA